MKGAFLVATTAELFDHLTEAMQQVTRSATSVAAGAAQYVDPSGRLFTVYAPVEEPHRWEVREGPFTLQSGSAIPDMSTVSACPVECRWEDLFAGLVSELSAVLPAISPGEHVRWIFLARR